jgi:hypothetical protein
LYFFQNFYPVLLCQGLNALHSYQFTSLGDVIYYPLLLYHNFYLLHLGHKFLSCAPMSDIAILYSIEQFPSYAFVSNFCPRLSCQSFHPVLLRKSYYPVLLC